MVTDQNEPAPTVRTEPPQGPHWLDRLCQQMTSAVEALVPIAAGVGFAVMILFAGIGMAEGLDLLASLF